MSAAESPSLPAKSFHASCSSPYEYSLSKRTKTLLPPSMIRSNVVLSSLMMPRSVYAETNEQQKNRKAKRFIDDKEDMVVTC